MTIMDAKQVDKIIKAVERFVPTLDDDLIAAMEELKRESKVA